jgi:Uma2 family endonuclease
MPTALRDPQVRKLTIADYYAMAEAGIIRPSERVELLNGRIIQMAPTGPRHQTIVDKLTEILVAQAKGRYRVRVDGPIRIPHFSEPEPDLVLYRRDLENKHPEPSDIYLAIEVSDTTLATDSGEKLQAYQEGRIKEYWIIDVANKAVRIHVLKEGRYVLRTKSRGTVSPQDFPDVRVQINALF